VADLPDEEVFSDAVSHATRIALKALWNWANPATEDAIPYHLAKRYLSPQSPDGATLHLSIIVSGRRGYIADSST